MATRENPRANAPSPRVIDDEATRAVLAVMERGVPHFANTARAKAGRGATFGTR